MKGSPGGNKFLWRLLEKQPAAYKDFTYNILAVVSGDKQMVLDAENGGSGS